MYWLCICVSLVTVVSFSLFVLVETLRTSIQYVLFPRSFIPTIGTRTETWRKASEFCRNQSLPRQKTRGNQRNFSVPCKRIPVGQQSEFSSEFQSNTPVHRIFFNGNFRFGSDHITTVRFQRVPQLSDLTVERFHIFPTNSSCWKSSRNRWAPLPPSSRRIPTVAQSVGTVTKRSQRLSTEFQRVPMKNRQEFSNWIRSDPPNSV